MQTKNGTNYDRETFCGTSLQLNIDFEWETDGRTSFAIDYGMLCNREYLFTLSNTLYFLGAMISLPLGGQFMDLYGRKRGIQVGSAFTIMAIVMESLPASISHVGVFIFSRMLIGMGCYVTYIGTCTYNLEICPTKNRPIGTLFYAYSWDFGYLLMVLFGYFIKNWNIFSAVPAVILILSIIFVQMVPESPKYLLLNKHDTKATKEALKWFAKINKSDFDIDAIELQSEAVKTKERTAKENFRDLKLYPELAIQTGILCFQWVVSAFVYYGFTFSWSKLSKNLYIGYLFAAIGDVVAVSCKLAVMYTVSRRWGTIGGYALAALTFYLAIIPYEFPGNVLSFEQLVCLLGSVAIGVGWGIIFLQGVEAAPTTHRAQLNTWVCSAGRIGAIAGTQASLLFNWNRTGAFVIFGTLTIVASLLGFRMPETKDIIPPETPPEVKRKYTRITGNDKTDC